MSVFQSEPPICSLHNKANIYSQVKSTLVLHVQNVYPLSLLVIGDASRHPIDCARYL